MKILYRLIIFSFCTNIFTTDNFSSNIELLEDEFVVKSDLVTDIKKSAGGQVVSQQALSAAQQAQNIALNALFLAEEALKIAKSAESGGFGATLGLQDQLELLVQGLWV